MTQIPFFAIAIGVILFVSAMHLFFTRSKIAAMIFSVLDLIVGLTLIGSKSIPAILLTYQIPESVVLYIGAGLTIKGIFYLVLSFR